MFCAPILRTAIATKLLLSLLIVGCVSAPQREQSSQTVAIVDGQSISSTELDVVVRPDLEQLRNQEYEIRRQALDGLIRTRLVEADAKKRGLTTQQLLDAEAGVVQEPNDEQLRSAYESQADLLRRPFAEVREGIRQALRTQQRQQAQQRYVESLFSRARVNILLSPPRTEVGVDPSRSRGDPNAPVTIVEFSDFECPYCRAAQPVLKQVLAKYAGRVRLAYRDWPISGLHPHAEKAAEAARCAGDFGKFWEYHDLLFADQRRLDADQLAEHAQTLGLDDLEFNACLASNKFQSKVKEDYAQGLQVGVTGTPSFFINGIFLSGAQPLAAFERIIDSELRAP